MAEASVFTKAQKFRKKTLRKVPALWKFDAYVVMYCVLKKLILIVNTPDFCS